MEEVGPSDAPGLRPGPLQPHGWHPYAIGEHDHGADSSPLDPGEQLWAPSGPTLAEWWHTLPLARRAVTCVGLALAVLGGGIGYAAANRTPAPKPVAVPWPTEVTRISYEGLHGPVDGGATFTLHMRVEVDENARVPVTITEVGQGYPSLSSNTVPATPIVVTPGESRRLAMIMHVRDCARTPVFARMPLVNVTLRNTRAIRTRSEIFGERYADALSSALRTLCPTGARDQTRTISR